MYQVIALSHSPERRMLLGAFSTKHEAVVYAEDLSYGTAMEVVDDRTGLLKATSIDGVTTNILTPTRRDIL